MGIVVGRSMHIQNTTKFTTTRERLLKIEALEQAFEKCNDTNGVNPIVLDTKVSVEQSSNLHIKTVDIEAYCDVL